ncbi:adenylate/guanylate cyclase domain-containing protein [Geminicoccus roseus]|uniref:adenylate/guanylate cyclase domain-containing protein n=1 Tax=Geminicoccus roseus TaxID=404900 RepID=UPI00040DFA88|nr:adenylate/guanylate cyclase domain-containing protein [Geminicoccus roseus]
MQERLSPPVVDFILEDATTRDDLPGLLGSACEKMVALGVPLWRMSVSMRAIHPTVTALTAIWRRGEGAAADLAQFGPGEEDRARYRRSPIAYLLESGERSARWDLAAGEGCDRFTLLAELRAAGAADYLLRVIPFGGDIQAALPGVVFGISTDRAGGPTPSQQAVIEAVLPALGLACLRFALARTMTDVLGVYLGPKIAQRVLSGEIRRGMGRRVTAAVLLADLRGFTALAGTEDPLRVVGWLDEHLEAMGGPVEAHGGEVLKFMGDGLLAVFAADGEGGGEADACARALAAAEEVLAQTARLNGARRAAGLPELELDVVLHHGEVVFGNVGALRRLDFTAIGRTVNEASRMEELCARLGRNLLLSVPFAERCGRPTASLGCFRLRGVADDLEVRVPA